MYENIVSFKMPPSFITIAIIDEILITGNDTSSGNGVKSSGTEWYFGFFFWHWTE